MSSEVIHFSCQACQHPLTVPAHLAGISGPCPVCGSTVTSPAAPTPAPAPIMAGFGNLPGSPPPAEASPPPLVSPAVQPIPGAALHSLGGFSGTAPPPPPPPWQQPTPATPGLGQTLLESGLPPRRAESQPPFLGGNSAPAQPAAPAWGTPAAKPQLPPLETAPPARGGLHSNLIPGAPALNSPAAQGQSDPGAETLLARGLPSAPLSQPNSSMPALSLPAQDRVASQPVSRSRPLARPKRGSNIFMIGLSVIFLGGFLAAVGWLFQDPIRQLIHRYTGPAEDVAATTPPTLPALPTTAEPPAIPAPESPAPTVADTQPGKTGSFDPQEPAPPVPAPAPPSPAPASQQVATAPLPEARPALPPEAPPATAPTPAPLVEVSATPVKNAASKLSSSPDPLPQPTSTEIRMDGVTPEAKAAADALLAFLKAGSLQERLRYSLAPEVMRPYMERYYAANPDGPIQVDAIALVRHDPKPQIGGGAHAVFGVESKTWEYALPVMLEEQQGSFKVDWLSFVEFKDRLLEKFLQGYQEGAARFHVGITRTHYFEDKVPNASTKDAFRLSPAPPNPFTATVFVDKESDLGRDLRDKIPWGSQVWAIVELEWIKLGNLSWVQLTGVPQLNWYSVPAEATPKRALPMTNGNGIPTETQKAVPVGRSTR